MTYTIYAAVNDVTGKAYVGQTRRKLRVRKAQHERDALKGLASGVFTKAIKKYGPAAFTWFVLETVADEGSANARELYYIQYLKTLAPVGYNLDSGKGEYKEVHALTKQLQSDRGRGRVRAPFSEEHRRNISKACKGRVSPNAGRELGSEHRRSLSEAHKGKTLSEETRKKVSKALRQRVCTETTREKMSQNRKDKKSIVLCHEVTGEVRSFVSQAAAYRELGLPQSSVNKLARGVYSSVGGWVLYSN